MLFGTPDLRQRQPQITISACGGMLESQGFVFDAIHENDTYPGKGVIIQLADRFLYHVAPCEALLIERTTFCGK
jgi:hypothetical protein